MPVEDQTKLSTFSRVVAPALFKRAAPWWVSAGRAAGTSLDDIARGGATAARAAEDIGRGASGGARMINMGAGVADDIGLGAATRAVPPTPSIRTGSPATPTTGFAPIPMDDVSAAYSRVAPPVSAPVPGAAAASDAASAAGAATNPALPSWAQRALSTYKSAPWWGKGLAVAGIGYPTYQFAQGQIGPGEFAARVGGDIATMGMGLPAQVLGGWIAPMAVGKFVDPALGWKPMEQRMQEAQATGQQEMLSAVQQELASRPPAAMQQAPQFTADELTISGPGGTQLRPELTMPFQMMQREAIRKQFPGLS